MEFPWKECWSGLPFLSPGDLPDLGIEPRSPVFPVYSLPSEPPGREALVILIYEIYPPTLIQSFGSIMSISTDSRIFISYFGL